MIGYLQGSLKSLDASRATIVTNGVGYEVHISLQTYYKLEGQREASAPSRLSVDDDVHSALVSLGYRPKDADLAIEAARKQLGSEAEFSAMLKAALRQLTKS